MNNTKDILNQPNNTYAGIEFKEWQSANINKLVLLYNDSALLSVPYLVNTVSNFYIRLFSQETDLIKASISAWPKMPTSTIESLDFSSFTFSILLGCGLLIPLVSFVTEVVHDRELKCRTQLRLSGCSFWNYWSVTLFCFMTQYAIMPLVLFTLTSVFSDLNIKAFEPLGAKLALVLTTIVYLPCVVVFSMCSSFLFSKKETAIGVLTALLILVMFFFRNSLMDYANSFYNTRN